MFGKQYTEAGFRQLIGQYGLKRPDIVQGANDGSSEMYNRWFEHVRCKERPEGIFARRVRISGTFFEQAACGHKLSGSDWKPAEPNRYRFRYEAIIRQAPATSREAQP